jgi:hypothetical protein
MHDTIETEGMRKDDVPALKERVKKIIEEPVEAWLKADANSEENSTAEAAFED